MKLKRSICLTIITLLIILPYNIYSETTKTNSFFDIQNGQLNISSISYELDMKNSIFAFTGDVEVLGDDMTMSCKKLELYFKGSLKDTSKEKGKFSIEKIVATESVAINSPAVGSATCEQAVYYPDKEQIILTGNPHLQYGDKYEGGGVGTVITLDLKEERFYVQGTKENKATAKTRIDTEKDEER